MSTNLLNSALIAYNWIANAVEQLTDNDTPLLLKTYVIAILCSDIEGKIHDRVSQIIDKIRAKLLVNLNNNIDKCDSVMLLLYYVVEQNIFNQSLPELRDYADMVSSALEEVSSSDIVPSYQAARILLYRLDLLPKPLPLNLTFYPDLFSIITGSEKLALDTVKHIDFITSYGHYSIFAPKGLDIVLESIMMHFLQKYKLETACNFLRVLSYLKTEESLSIRTARHFIFTNQEFEGSFGFIDKQVRYISLKTSEPQALLQLKIPMTLTCLWSLAESDLVSYRLFWDLGKQCCERQ